MIDITEARSPGWWLARLMVKLGERQARYELLDSYYRGDPPLPWGPEGCRQAFQKFQRKARLNLAAMIADSVTERMKPVGFRTGASADQEGDDQAWKIWQANNLDAEAPLLFSTCAVMSEAYTIVGGPDPDTKVPVISCEDPRQVITEQDPANRRRTIAALKVWVDDVDGVDRAKLYLPGIVYSAVRRNRPTGELMSFDPSGWEWEDDGQKLPAFAARIVPVTRFVLRSNLAGDALGEFEDCIDDFDRINLMLLQRLTVAVMQAFRQRALKNGDALPDTDEDGEEIDYNDIFSADPGAFWMLPEGVEVWESAGVDLTPLLESVKADIRDVLATSRTPLHYMFPDAAGGSAEGASLGREGLIFRAGARITQAEDPLEQTMSLALLFMGEKERAQRPDLEVIWQAPERVSTAERYDAAVKAQAAGVPWTTIMRDILGFSPQQIETMRAERMAEAFAAAPTPTGTSVDVAAGR